MEYFIIKSELLIREVFFFHFTKSIAGRAARAGLNAQWLMDNNGIRKKLRLKCEETEEEIEKLGRNCKEKRSIL